MLKNLLLNDVADRATIINKGCANEPKSALMNVFPRNSAASKIYLDGFDTKNLAYESTYD